MLDENEPNSDDQQNNDQTNTSQTAAPPIPAPPAPPAAAPSINPDGLRNDLDLLSRRAMGEMSNEITQLRQEIQRLQSAPAPQQNEANFFERPREIIREEVQQTVAPLLDFQKAYQRDQQYQMLKRQVLASPQLGPLLRQVESVVDQMMQGADPTPASMQAAIFSAIGMQTAGLIPANATTPPAAMPATPPVHNNQPNGGPVIPPNIPPSAPPPPRRTENTDPNKRPLTESERRIKEAMGLKSDEEYLAYLNAPPEVDAWKDIK